jgi:CheY-specific phosphatase CheX
MKVVYKEGRDSITIGGIGTVKKNIPIEVDRDTAERLFALSSVKFEEVKQKDSLKKSSIKTIVKKEV